MKTVNNYKRVAGYVSKIWNAINERYYSNELQLPVTITIQSTVSAYGHCSCNPIWSNGVIDSYEINLGAEYINRPIENVVATLIHESCHLWAIQEGIKDTSGYYHNKKFRDLAVARGLDIQKHEKYGWTITSPTDETIMFCLDYGFEDIELGRQTSFGFGGIGGDKSGNGGVMVPRTKKPSNYRRYVCPCCGTIARTTKDARLICGDCMKEMVLTV